MLEQKDPVGFVKKDASKVIVCAWVNDEDTKRAYESSDDACRVIRKIQESGHPRLLPRTSRRHRPALFLPRRSDTMAHWVAACIQRLIGSMDSFGHAPGPV